MRLQIALDTTNTAEAVAILEELHSLINIVEIGTPMLLHYGMEPVKTVRKAFPALTVLADTKIMDAGEYEADIAYHAGADIATVMGITNDETIQGCVTAAKRAGKAVMADMMCVENLSQRAKELVAMGVSYVCVHTAVDIQSRHNPYEELASITEAVGAEHCAIAGGLTTDTIVRVLPYRPEIVIVGNGITGAVNPSIAAQAIQNAISAKGGA